MVEQTKLVDAIGAVRELVTEARSAQGRVGFVPTMGYLHQGHLSLVAASVKECDFTVVSIFVNPSQFGPDMDYDSYPRDLDRDLELLRSTGTNLVFAPGTAEIYSQDFATWVEVQGLTTHFNGASREGYFTGICTVVLKLFNIVRPDLAYFGQKDIQQALVLRKMIADLNLDIDLKIMPIVREADGLAMSSRNVRLKGLVRSSATALYRGLLHAKELFEQGHCSARLLTDTVREVIGGQPEIKIDYVEVVSYELLQPVTTVHNRCILAVAVELAGVRLIDNILLNG